VRQEFAMRSGYSNFSWLIRAARVVPVIAAAALVGGMIGGFAMFVIDSVLTWEPSPQSSSDIRADNQTAAVSSQQTKPVRIVGGAIPDPSAGMSAPPPVQQPQPQQPQQRGASPDQSAAQISPAMFAPNPLGPASPLQPQTAATALSSGTPPHTQTHQLPVRAQNAPTNGGSAQPQTRWPDALSRAHQNAANPQQQTAPAAAPAAPAQNGDHAAANNSGTDRKDANSDRAVSNEDQGRADGSRNGRHSRRHAWRYGSDDEASGTAASSRRQQTRSDDRLYDSYGNRRGRSYGNARQQFYRDRDDQSGAAPPFEAARPRPEPFWGGGDFRRAIRTRTNRLPPGLLARVLGRSPPLP
jgi:hypothetical protein